MDNKVNVKKDETVVILSGKDRGKRGKVLRVVPDKGMVLVEGVNMSTKHTKPKRQGQLGGIIHQESPIRACKVMHVCNRCGEPTRAGRKILESGEKTRMCKRCGEEFN